MGLVEALKGGGLPRSATLLVVACTLLAGCAKPGTEDPGPPAGSVLVVGVLGPLGSLDPASPGAVAASVVLPNVFASLARVAEDGAIRPALARSWSAGDAQDSWRVSLREGAVFHDGTPVNASDAKFALDRARGRVAGEPSAGAAALANVAEVHVLDARTLEVALREPDASFPARLALVTAAIVPPSAYSLAEHRTGVRVELPVGAGPFRVTAASPSEVQLLTRGGTRVERVVVRAFPDADALAGALRSGDVEVAFGLDAARASALARENATVAWFPAPEARVLAFDASRAPFADEHARRAVAYALDRAALAGLALGGNASRMDGLAPGASGFKDRFADAPDATRALSELALAGYRPDRPLAVTIAYAATAFGEDEDLVAFAIERMLEATGAIEVEVQAREASAFAADGAGAPADLVLARVAPRAPHAIAWHEAALRASGARVAEDALAKLAEERRSGEAGAFEAWAAEEAHAVPLWSARVPVAHRGVEGMEIAHGALLLAGARAP